MDRSAPEKKSLHPLVKFALTLGLALVMLRFLPLVLKLAQLAAVGLGRIGLVAVFGIVALWVLARFRAQLRRASSTARSARSATWRQDKSRD